MGKLGWKHPRSWFWLALFCASAVVAFFSTVHAAGEGRGGNAPELDRFLPEGVDRLYQRGGCKIRTDDPCTLWVAGAQDSRYMILQPKGGASWKDLGIEAVLRSVLPDESPMRFEPVAKSNVTDPDTWAVRGAGFSGHVQVIDRSDAEVIVVWMPDSPLTTTFKRITPTAAATPPPRVLKEIRVSNQPDVIEQDSLGFLWFSAWMNEIYRIDPAIDIPQPMTGATATGTPDGLTVDSGDLVWYGGYNQQYLGVLSEGNPVTRYNAPYTRPFPAIPCEAPDGNIWTTDHPNNRITEFNPFTEQWGRAVTITDGPGYPVQCLKDPDGSALWVTLYNANALGRIDLDTATLTKYPVPCAPAFIAFDGNGSLWASCWNNGHIIQFDPVGLTGTDWVIPAASQAGGISVGPNGLVVFTQNAVGRVGVLNPESQEVYTYNLPSRPMFKDSVLVDRTGTIWAPSPFGSLVGKIVPE